jgi:oxygen-dependent protoporphyrinogen oxidase
MVARPRVAVIGAGISGLATAYHLSRASGSIRPVVTVFEADTRPGGKIRTETLANMRIDVGPETVGAQPPGVSDLIAELGLAGAVVSPRVSGNYLWTRGRLRRVPAGSLFGLSERPLPLLRAGLLTLPGVLRAGLDLVLPRTPLPEDPSVGQLLRPRFGSEVCDYLVEPMLAGAYSGRLDTISARATVPEIEALARRHRSLYLALLGRKRKLSPPAGPMMYTVDGGLGRLVDALVREIPEVRLGTPISTVEPTGTGYLVRPVDGPAVPVDAVVLAVPTFAAADLLAGLSPDVATVLREVSYVDLMSVTLGYPAHAIGQPLDATGFLVPPAESRPLLGCTWLSAKWPHLSGQPVVPIRCLVAGGSAAPTDDEVVQRVHRELVAAMGLTAPPSHTLVQRWPRAIAQYTVGHPDRVARIDAAVRRLPGLHLTGAGYRGASLSRCATEARKTANAVLAGLAAGPELPPDSVTHSLLENGYRLEHAG